MKYICTSYIWWRLYKTLFNVTIHVFELMEPARTTKELFIVLLLLKKSFNIILYLIKVISLRIAQNTKFRKFWDEPWIRKRIIFSIQVSLFSVRWRTFLSLLEEHNNNFPKHLFLGLLQRMQNVIIAVYFWITNTQLKLSSYASLCGCYVLMLF